MKREIKFRGKDVETDKWVDGDLIQRMGYMPSIMFPYNSNGKVRYGECAVKRETVGQFTGLTDKNGNEIYEGDILRGDKYPFNCDGVDNYFAEIVWSDDVCGFYRITIKNPNSTVRGTSHGNWEQLDIDDIKSFEVIGNIHDNPELLKD